MSPNWSRARTQVKGIVAGNGQTLQWLVRSTSGSTAYDTGSATTYGYGDPIVYWTTGSFVAIVRPIRDRDVVVEAGFFSDDYKKLWLDPDDDPSFWDQVLIPSGSSIRHIVLGTHDWDVGGVEVSKIVDVRRLNPRSGSAY